MKWHTCVPTVTGENVTNSLQFLKIGASLSKPLISETFVLSTIQIGLVFVDKDFLACSRLV